VVSAGCLDDRSSGYGVLTAGQDLYFGHFKASKLKRLGADMDPESAVEELVEPLRADRLSGASVLSRTAADVLRRAAVRLQAGSLEELQWGLGEVCRSILDAQPAMAPLVTLIRLVMNALERVDSLEAGRLAAAHAADEFRQGAEGRIRAVAAAGATVLPSGGTVATISSSATVQALLIEEAGPRGVTVLCFESRPMNEGRLFATALAKAGVEVRFAVDAATAALVPRCDAVIVGADSVGDEGVVNKIGTTALARAAHLAGIPVYVLADETKMLPVGFPQILDDDRSRAEVWDAPSGVDVWNRYFEITGMRSITGVVTETGVLTPAQTLRKRGDLTLPAGLRAWATGRM